MRAWQHQAVIVPPPPPPFSSQQMGRKADAAGLQETSGRCAHGAKCRRDRVCDVGDAKTVMGDHSWRKTKIKEFARHRQLTALMIAVPQTPIDVVKQTCKGFTISLVIAKCKAQFQSANHRKPTMLLAYPSLPGILRLSAYSIRSSAGLGSRCTGRRFRPPPPPPGSVSIDSFQVTTGYMVYQRLQDAKP